MKARRGRLAVVATAWLASALVAGFAGWWAGSQVSRPPQLGAESPAPVTVAVTEGSIEVLQPYSVTANWGVEAVGANGREGTLTSLSLGTRAKQVRAGEVLYSVDLLPVVAVPGEVPAFRDLALGLVGPDVVQLESYLVSAGFMAGKPDQTFDEATSAAVKAWERKLGLSPTGAVPLGRVIFIDRLPAAMAVGPELRVGASVAKGQSLLLRGRSDPAFTIPVLQEAVAQLKPGTVLRISAGKREWQAQVLRVVAAPDGSGQVGQLGPVAGQTSICGAACSDDLVLGTRTVLPGTIVLVPLVKGAVVPAAAVWSDVAGSSCLTLEGGSLQRVTVRASDAGRSVVEGVSVGARVVVDADPGSGTC